MRIPTPHLALAVLVLVAPGCDEPEETADALAAACKNLRGDEKIETPADAGIRLQVTSGRTVGPPATDLTVRGVAEHDYGFAIHSLAVAGIAAKSEDFNYRQWSAVVPLALLTTLPRDTATGEVLVDLEVRDSCGAYTEPDDKRLRITIDAASLTIDGPAYADPNAAYVPATGTDAATVTIHAAKEAAGARIRVTSQPAAQLVLDGVSGGFVTLQAVDDQARAVVRVTSKTAGAYTLLASSATTTATAGLTVAGAPSFVPGTVTLTPGAIRNITVLSDGDLRECWAEGVPEGVLVTLDGADLAKMPASQADNTKAWTLTIAVDMTFVGDVAASVHCRDIYRQQTTLAPAIDG